jgi:hypothetical protein
VNYQQHGNRFLLAVNRADRVPTLFSRCAIDAIRNNEAVFVIEDQGRQLECTPSWFR